MSDAADATPEFDEGRYVYCAVTADPGATISVDGIEGRPVSLVVHDGIGVAVQPVGSVYDSADPTRVRRWLVSHQEVVDEVGREFGTPLPFRFDTILAGTDATVREWLDERHGEVADALDRLAGLWEYRIEVRWDEAAVGDRVREDDAELRELNDRIETASEGTSYLLEKQYRRRERELLERRRRDIEATVSDGIAAYADEVRRADADSRRFGGERDDGLETAVRLSVLADGAEEERIGEALESIAARPDHEVRYTGPWPPYSFAPQIGPEAADATSVDGNGEDGRDTARKRDESEDGNEGAERRGKRGEGETGGDAGA
jgi:hypothetical protein